jgi:hypothetical protein
MHLWGRYATDRRVEALPGIFDFFARNPLTSPDSEKKMKRNESNFACFFFHFLSFSCVWRLARAMVAFMTQARASACGPAP